MGHVLVPRHFFDPTGFLYLINMKKSLLMISGSGFFMISFLSSLAYKSILFGNDEE